MSKEAVARGFLDHVIHDRVGEIERCLREGNALSWRHIVRYELPMTALLAQDPGTDCSGDVNDQRAAIVERAATKLLSYEIVNVSALHAAALLGRRDCLITILDRDVPVDTPLSTGTTPLHMACFGGHEDTIRMLISVYRADINGQDRYGWTALHYAATEGKIGASRILLEDGADVMSRDQDGTTAAYRAQYNGHSSLVNFLCEHGSADDMLNIEEDHTHVSKPVTDIYSKPNKQKPMDNNPCPINNRHSMPVSNNPTSDTQDHFQTMPGKLQRQTSTNSVRRVIRTEIEQAFGLDDYMRPTDVKPDDSKPELDMANIGMKTLSGLMREEFEKYRRQIVAQISLEESLGQQDTNTGSGIHCGTGGHGSDSGVSQTAADEGDYDELYATLSQINMLPQAPQPPAGPLVMSGSAAPNAPNCKEPPPPLPPRNNSIRNNSVTDFSYDFDRSVSLSDRPEGEHGNAALTEAIRRVVRHAGSQWKRLAHVLPIDVTTARVSTRIMAIESQHPGDIEKQATKAMAEWRINAGSTGEAHLDGLIHALRRAELYDVISDVERVASEFTA